ncbi:MAG: hypothetical protein ABII12_11960 [Planctomycetota bacterium]
MTSYRDARCAARWVAAGCVVLTMFLPLTAYAADRVVLGEYFNGTW